MPIAADHGEGPVEVRDTQHLSVLENDGLVALHFINDASHITEDYLANPNDLPNGIAAVTSINGGATVMMLHLSRARLPQCQQILVSEIVG